MRRALVSALVLAALACGAPAPPQAIDVAGRPGASPLPSAKPDAPPPPPPWCASEGAPADLTVLPPDVRLAVQQATQSFTEAGPGPAPTCAKVLGLRDLHLGPIPSLSGVEHLRGLVRLTVESVGDGDLRPLQALPLEALDVGPPIHELRRDAVPALIDLSAVGAIATLRSLRIAGSAVSDLRPLARLSHLEHLVLPSNRIADTSPLASLGALTLLVLDDNAVTEMAPLAALPALGELRLTGNPLDHLPPLAGLARLRMLVVARTRITDAWPLLSLPTAQQIVLCGSPVIEDPKVAARNKKALAALRARKVAVPDFTGCHCC